MGNESSSSLQEREMDGSGGGDQPGGEHGRRKDTTRLRLVLQADGYQTDGEDEEVDGVRNLEANDSKGRRSSVTSSHTH
ncbi:hypothetical protein CSUI_008118, partial [Cystoisospora suis]